MSLSQRRQTGPCLARLAQKIADATIRSDGPVRALTTSDHTELEKPPFAASLNLRPAIVSARFGMLWRFPHMHSRLWLSDARGELSTRAGSRDLEFFYAPNVRPAVRARERRKERYF